MKPEPQPFDLSNLNRMSIEFESHWSHWQDLFVNDLQERWMQATNCAIAMTFAQNQSIEFDRARDQFPRPSIGWEARVESESISSLIVLQRSLALALALQMLGQPTDKLPEDRPLSEIEMSVCEFIFANFTKSLNESWPQKQPQRFDLLQPEFLAHKNRLWEPGQLVVNCRAEINLGADAGQFIWAIPVDQLEQLLSKLETRPVAPSDALKQQMETKACEIPLPVSVELGSAIVSVNRLANLKVGDIVVFDQRISEPLPLKINQKTKFLGWLGRNGNKQSFKISESI